MNSHGVTAVVIVIHFNHKIHFLEHYAIWPQNHPMLNTEKKKIVINYYIVFAVTCYYQRIYFIMKFRNFRYNVNDMFRLITISELENILYV